MAKDARINTTDIAIISSRSVKPRNNAPGPRSVVNCPLPLFLCPLLLSVSNPLKSQPATRDKGPRTTDNELQAEDKDLPIGIPRPIQCLALALGIDIEDVLPTPASGIRI